MNKKRTGKTWLVAAATVAVVLIGIGVAAPALAQQANRSTSPASSASWYALGYREGLMGGYYGQQDGSTMGAGMMAGRGGYNYGHGGQRSSAVTGWEPMGSMMAGW